MGVQRHCQVKKAGKWVDQGPRIRFWNNGRKAMLWFERDGSEYGPYRMWHGNGRKWIEGSVERGVTVGPHKEWYTNGQLKAVGRYDRHGHRVGTWKYWTRSGKPTATEPWP